MMADGLIMRVNMTQDEGGMSLYYSVVTHDLCVAPDELLGDENEAVLSAAEWFRTNVSENNDGRNLYAMLLTSSYRDPREIDLSKLFYNGLYDASNVITEEERTAVSQENPLARPSGHHQDHAHADGRGAAEAHRPDAKGNRSGRA